MYLLVKIILSPAWSLNGVELVNSDSIKYLGVTLANEPSVHVNDVFFF